MKIVVSDDKVYGIYGKDFPGLKAFVFENGEKSKNLKTYQDLMHFLAEEKVEKTDTLIALGGGVVGDLTGFAAATFKRGMKYISIPTTLMAMIDSSIGGKTGVNLDEGKNLVGAIYPAEEVILDFKYLKTLDKRQFNSAMAEVIKYQVITGENLVDMPLEDMVRRCIKIKEDIVKEDPLDQGKRMILNLGHTVGHAVEKLSGYTLLHGEAVAIGLAEIARYSKMEGLDQLISLLKRYDLPTELTYPRDKVMEAIREDKKIRNGVLTLVLPKAFGKVEVKHEGDN
ncbi:MAG: 3-dehydroquinate synthase [Clostridia bacterium]|nr:3-dehydroquinate synthase [Clostridia bacterium]